MLKAIVIDDEKDAVEFIKSLIDEYCSDITVIDEAFSGNEAYKKIVIQKPNLIFLDVEMPNGNGFDLLEKFNTIDFKIIFITAYDHYAIKAIKYSALDYILKPIDIEEFLKAVNKVRAAYNSNSELADFKVLLENLKTNLPSKIAIPTNKGIEYIETNDILRIEADRSYSILYLVNGTKIMVSRGLIEFQELLIDRNFFRTHNSHLINLEYVKMYSKQDGGFIKMCDDSIVSLSRNKKESFIKKMREYSINLNK